MGNDVVPWAFAVRTVAAKTGNGAVNDSGVHFFQDVVTEAELVHDAGTVILDDHVSRLDHFKKKLFSLWSLHVKRNALFVAVHVGVVHAAFILVRTEIAGVVAFAGDLDLDDFGPHVREHHRAIWPRQNPSEIENANVA